MNTDKPILAIASLILAGAAVTGGIVMTGEEVAEIITAPAIVEQVKEKPVMVATEITAAPSDPSECSGGVVSTGDALLCFAPKSTEAHPAASISTAAPDEKDRWSMWACPATEELPARVEWLRKKETCKGGVMVLKSQHKAVWQGETEITDKLRERCAPCAVTSQSWGMCPLCLLDKGGCAAVCKTTEIGVSK